MKYVRGGIMALLLKEVEEGSAQNRQPGKKLWRVKIGGELIGFIQTGWSLNKRYKYTATSTRGHEYDSCQNFMKALSQFISPAVDAIDRQGMKERAYVGKVGATNYSDFHFLIEEARYDGQDEVCSYALRSEEVIKSYNGPSVTPKYQVITTFELRYQILMGLMVVE